jgi:hypothetical protein
VSSPHEAVREGPAPLSERLLYLEHRIGVLEQLLQKQALEISDLRFRDMHRGLDVLRLEAERSRLRVEILGSMCGPAEPTG